MKYNFLYLKVLISQSKFVGPLELETTRVDCIFHIDGKLYIFLIDGKLYVFLIDGKLYIFLIDGKLYIMESYIFS